MTNKRIELSPVPATDHYPSSSSKLQPPSLMVRIDQEQDDDHNACYFSLTENPDNKLNNLEFVFKDISGEQSRCIGSSQGRLILLDEEIGSFIFFDPLNVDIQMMKVPSLLTLPWSGTITKVILTPDPIKSFNYNKFGVVIIYGFSSKLAISWHGDNKWTVLEGSHEPYADIICRENHLFALSEVGTIEVWEFNSGLIPMRKKMTVQAMISDEVVECRESFKDLYTTKLYLVESRSDFLLVMRCIGEFVKDAGEVICEGGLLDDEVFSHLDNCAYMTKKFYVYKLDLERKQWVQVESLGDCALFLGGNQSRCVSALDFQEFKGNSIYFTDDYWDRMGEHDMHGGHDMGVFDLEDGSIKHFCPTGLEKIDPAAFWIV